MKNIDANIKDLENLLQPYFGGENKIIKRNVSLLTAPGENYGSVMLKVDLILRKGSTDKEECCAIAKTIPDTELFRKIFNIQVTFKNEIAFYDTIVPTLKQFKSKHGVIGNEELFPKFLGGRINLTGESSLVDEDGVIVLENLKVAGYQTINRQIGFDLITTELVLKNMAKFHAIPLALKLKDPELFQSNCKQYCACFHPRSEDGSIPIEGTLQIIKEQSTFKSVIKKIERSLKNIAEYPSKFREPFSTILHDDLWVNNIMIKYENGVPVNSKFVDFQMYTYDTPVKDLLFFLITSVPLGLLKEHFDEFLILYHKCFIKFLLDFNCDISPFSYNKFLDEIKAVLQDEIGHILFMTMFIVLAKKDGTNITSQEVLDNPLYVTFEGKEKSWWFVEECMKRGFL